MTVHTVDRLEALPEPTPDGTIVVVDVIISSTAIIRLLEAGATAVVPFRDGDEARAFGEANPDALLVGEDGGEPMPGFDIVPLPSVIESTEVAGRPVALRSSNGTRAVARLGRSEDVLIGSTINAAAVARELPQAEDCWLVAAGRQGQAVPEDSAGVELIESHYRGIEPETATLRRQISESETAEWFRRIGFGADIETTLQFDSTEIVPRLHDGVFQISPGSDC